MSLWNLIFQTGVIEQGFGTGVLPHHDECASENGDPAQHGKNSYLIPRFCCISAFNHGDFFNTHL